MTIAFDSLHVFLFVFVRLCGMIVLNPMFARRNVPNTVRMGLAFFMTVLIAPQLSPISLQAVGDFELVFFFVKELAIGAFLGYIFQVFYFMLFFAGDYMDTAFGMSMAKVFDPGTNIQMSISSNLLSIWFIIYVFLTDGHLAILHLFASSFRILPIGALVFSPEMAIFAMEIFTQVFMLAIRLLLPFAVAEFVMEVSMGILMKVIPQIHIFVINFQLKMALGMITLLLFAPAVSGFIDNYLVFTLDTLQQSLIVAGGVL